MATTLLLCTSLAAADAASSAKVASTTAVTSGHWGAVATTGTATNVSGPLELTFPGTTPEPQYFNVVNTGALSLTSQIYKATTTGNSVEIQMCSTTWNEPNGSCSGNLTTVPINGSTIFTAPLPATGSKIRLRARIIGLQLLGSSTVTISVSVTRAQVRAASVTGS